MTMTDDQVRLGAAMMMIRRYGEQAPLRVAERIGELAVAGDAAGVAAWKIIAQRMDRILRAGPAQ